VQVQGARGGEGGDRRRRERPRRRGDSYKCRRTRSSVGIARHPDSNLMLHILAEVSACVIYTLYEITLVFF